MDNHQHNWTFIKHAFLPDGPHMKYEVALILCSGCGQARYQPISYEYFYNWTKSDKPNK